MHHVLHPLMLLVLCYEGGFRLVLSSKRVWVVWQRAMADYLVSLVVLYVTLVVADLCGSLAVT